MLDENLGVGTNGSDFTNGVTYTGRRLDTETVLCYYRHRYYDPALGRFTSRDPIGYEGGGGNLYEYVASAPSRNNDPFGLLVTECVVAGATADAAIPEPTDLAAPIKFPAWATLLILGMGIDAAVDTITDWKYGDCTKERHSELHKAVSKACKVPRKCDGITDCEELKRRHNQNIKCALARDSINIECFRGGDKTHRDEADKARETAARCWDRVLIYCPEYNQPASPNAKPWEK